MKFIKYSLTRYRGNSANICAIEQGGFGNGILKITAGTTGYCGGDSGHGAKAFVEFHMEGGDLSTTGDNGEDCNVEKLVLSVGGDWEIDALIEGLEFAANALKLITTIKENL